MKWRKRECSKEELAKFIANYPRKLDHDVYRVPEPPVATWNDFTLGNWPDSVVCGQVLASQSYLGGEDRYYICEPETE